MSIMPDQRRADGTRGTRFEPCLLGMGVAPFFFDFAEATEDDGNVGLKKLPLVATDMRGWQPDCHPVRKLTCTKFVSRCNILEYLGG